MVPLLNDLMVIKNGIKMVKRHREDSSAVEYGNGTNFVIIIMN